jgi:hypothetical protein
MAAAIEVKRSVAPIVADGAAVNASIASLVALAKSQRPSLVGEGAGSALYALDKASLIAALDRLRATARQQRLDVCTPLCSFNTYEICNAMRNGDVYGERIGHCQYSTRAW